MDRVMLTAREVEAIRKHLWMLYRRQSDIRIREPVRKMLLALDRAERATPRRLRKTEDNIN